MTFGQMPIANGFLKKKFFKNEFLFEMEVGFSKDISLFQLNDHPKPEKMFNKNYPFFTSSSKYMIKHFYDYSKWIKKYKWIGWLGLVAILVVAVELIYSDLIIFL